MQDEQPAADAGPKPGYNLLLIIGAILLIVAGGVIFFATHTSDNGKTSSSQASAAVRFKTAHFTDLSGVRYAFDFYDTYKTTKLKSGNSQLVAEASRGGKFPLTISISSGEAAGFAEVKNCAKYTKVFDVQNASLGQKIAVCDIAAGRQSGGQDTSDTVYVAGFIEGGQAHIVTISQDFSSVDRTSQQTARKSYQKFGMKPYAADIKRIIASLKVEQQI